MIYEISKNKKLITSIVIILLIISGVVYKNTVLNSQTITVEEVIPPAATQEKNDEVKEENSDITVYVCGSVKNITNVTLSKGSRVEEAIRLAGGVTEKADLNGINMAQKLADEDIVYVPQKGEIIVTDKKNANVTALSAKKGKLNINKATEEQLDALPGVGPSTAKKIVEYRSSIGGFKSIEELNEVSGIGEAKFNDIKNLITVEQ